MDQVSKVFVDLIIDTQYLNHIFLIVTESVPLDKSFVDQFKKRILARAVSSNNALLMALAQESLSSTLDPVLEDLPIDMHNYLLFSLSSKRSVEAFEFLKKSRVDFSKKEDFCFKAGLLKDLALNYKRAAGIYKENGDLFDALRCYTKIKDLLGIAKTFEAMHRFEDALVVYTKLGKSSAIAKMEKLNKLQYIQKELF